MKAKLVLVARLGGMFQEKKNNCFDVLLEKGDKKEELVLVASDEETKEILANLDKLGYQVETIEKTREVGRDEQCLDMRDFLSFVGRFKIVARVLDKA